MVSIGGDANIANLNPIRYRGYYYDAETGFYYLNSRYYDPEICRFINADGYVSTGQGLLGNNMFAYCLNNPINMLDSMGTEAVIGGISIGLLIVRALTAIGVSVSVSLLLGTAISELAHIQSKDWIKEKTEEKDIVIPRIPDIPITFPQNPLDFHPRGLIPSWKSGTKNGCFILWKNQKGEVVFRWDENLRYDNGSHYHIYGEGHYYAGDLVPEPYATIYFGGL